MPYGSTRTWTEVWPDHPLRLPTRHSSHLPTLQIIHLQYRQLRYMDLKIISICQSLLLFNISSIWRHENCHTYWRICDKFVTLNSEFYGMLLLALTVCSISIGFVLLRTLVKNSLRFCVNSFSDCFISVVKIVVQINEMIVNINESQKLCGLMAT